MAKASTLTRSISPPLRRKSLKSSVSTSPRERFDDPTDSKRRPKKHAETDATPSLAAIEAGEAQIRDHLDYFSKYLRKAIRPCTKPSLSIEQFENVYKRNQHRHGRHFVVHQHDHPISGVHYDLRLQFSESSTISFAIPYGLPGNPHSVRPLRMAIETRVHTLWNNLIEAASHNTGSLLIWDTGEYEVLPYRESRTRHTDDELSDSRLTNSFERLPHSERLTSSFQRRRIRLRLHGTHLPPNYTISMWLPSTNDRDGQPKRPKRKRRRVDPAVLARQASMASSGDDNTDAEPAVEQSSNSGINENDEEAAIASDIDEDATIRANNAYHGASNTIGSIHQRNWILALDKKNSGFRKARGGSDEGRWIGSWEPFYVRGRDHERSVVTARSADDIMGDEDVERFVGRKMWRPIME